MERRYSEEAFAYEPSRVGKGERRRGAAGGAAEYGIAATAAAASGGAYPYAAGSRSAANSGGGMSARLQSRVPLTRFQARDEEDAGFVSDSASQPTRAGGASARKAKASGPSNDLNHAGGPALGRAGVSVKAHSASSQHQTSRQLVFNLEDFEGADFDPLQFLRKFLNLHQSPHPAASAAVHVFPGPGGPQFGRGQSTGSSTTPRHSNPRTPISEPRSMEKSMDALLRGFSRSGSRKETFMQEDMLDDVSIQQSLESIELPLFKLLEEAKYLERVARENLNKVCVQAAREKSSLAFLTAATQVSLSRAELRASSSIEALRCVIEPVEATARDKDALELALDVLNILTESEHDLTLCRAALLVQKLRTVLVVSLRGGSVSNSSSDAESGSERSRGLEKALLRVDAWAHELKSALPEWFLDSYDDLSLDEEERMMRQRECVQASMILEGEQALYEKYLSRIPMLQEPPRTFSLLSMIGSNTSDAQITNALREVCGDIVFTVENELSFIKQVFIANPEDIVELLSRSLMERHLVGFCSSVVSTFRSEISRMSCSTSWNGELTRRYLNRVAELRITFEATRNDLTALAGSEEIILKIDNVDAMFRSSSVDLTECAELETRWLHEEAEMVYKMSMVTTMAAGGVLKKQHTRRASGSYSNYSDLLASSSTVAPAREQQAAGSAGVSLDFALPLSNPTGISSGIREKIECVEATRRVLSAVVDSLFRAGDIGLAPRDALRLCICVTDVFLSSCSNMLKAVIGMLPSSPSSARNSEVWAEGRSPVKLFARTLAQIFDSYRLMLEFFALHLSTTGLLLPEYCLRVLHKLREDMKPNEVAAQRAAMLCAQAIAARVKRIISTGLSSPPFQKQHSGSDAHALEDDPTHASSAPYLTLSEIAALASGLGSIQDDARAGSEGAGFPGPSEHFQRASAFLADQIEIISAELQGVNHSFVVTAVAVAVRDAVLEAWRSMKKRSISCASARQVVSDVVHLVGLGFDHLDARANFDVLLQAALLFLCDPADLWAMLARYPLRLMPGALLAELITLRADAHASQVLQVCTALRASDLTETTSGGSQFRQKIDVSAISMVRSSSTVAALPTSVSVSNRSKRWLGSRAGSHDWATASVQDLKSRSATDVLASLDPRRTPKTRSSERLPEFHGSPLRASAVSFLQPSDST
ncbi:hypothetical protein FVE85_4062 [Porphyridium purpureum]|uniref:Uncharacterized protein n=1 Tax=Porphyridium purpureum TaxID=35688 RepID=A0A5J4YUJ6_PORPP|nr:hypothetical protein FVE85_4062 [Porphyridium purpureum]|eukprot:POR3207..scf229_5